MGWGLHGASFGAACSSVLIPGNQRLKFFHRSSFRTCTRVCSSRCAPRCQSFPAPNSCQAAFYRVSVEVPRRCPITDLQRDAYLRRGQPGLVRTIVWRTALCRPIPRGVPFQKLVM